jgi:hypothetical protein
MKGIGRGAVLADDMGLGKTLSSITITYVMLNSGRFFRPNHFHQFQF